MHALSPDTLSARARTAGVAYLATIVCGVFAEGFVRGGMLAPRDAAATAVNIVASETLYRVGGVADIVMLSAYIVVTLLFLELFEPVSRAGARLAAMFSVVGIAVLAANTLNHFAALALLAGPPVSGGVPQPDAQALAYLFLRLHSLGYDVSSAFFGVYCILIGWLVARSRFLPKLLGTLMIVAGLAYLTNGLAKLAGVPPRGALADLALLPGLIGESALGLWLTARSVNVLGWSEQLRTAEGRP